MVCTKCGFECGEDSKFCPKCGTKLVRECKSCGAVLTEGDFCPKCGTDNSEKKKTGTMDVIGVIAFILILVISGLKIVGFFSTNGYINFVFKNYFYNISYTTVAAFYSLLAAAVIVFSCLFRKNGKKGFGITAIVCAAVLKVCCSLAPMLFVLLICTIVHYLAVADIKE